MLSITRYRNTRYWALWENGQQTDGSITIPEVLRKYLDGQARIEPARRP